MRSSERDDSYGDLELEAASRILSMLMALVPVLQNRLASLVERIPPSQGFTQPSPRAGQRSILFSEPVICGS